MITSGERRSKVNRIARRTGFVAIALWHAACAPAQPAGEPHVEGEETPLAHRAAAPHAATAHHGATVPTITYTELQKTSAQLAGARLATAQYQDVRVAEANGYRRIGPNVAGMGTHYVRSGGHEEFSITEPPILLYQRDADAPNGLRLVGVSYLLVATTGTDGQPAESPFPRSLASWHKHNNVCVLPDNSASIELTEQQCTGRQGRFTGETSWMVHAWIWSDNPSGVFGAANPLVK